MLVDGQLLVDNAIPAFKKVLSWILIRISTRHLCPVAEAAKVGMPFWGLPRGVAMEKVVDEDSKLPQVFDAYIVTEGNVLFAAQFSQLIVPVLPAEFIYQFGGDLIFLIRNPSPCFGEKIGFF